MRPSRRSNDEQARARSIVTRLASSGVWPPLARLPEEWSAEVAKLGGRSFNGKQIFRWIHARGVLDPEKMTDLSAALRLNLRELGQATSTALQAWTTSLDRATERRATDGTRKLLVRLGDGAAVETVLIPGVTRGKSGMPSPISPKNDDKDPGASDDADA